jgi:GNAT superfamily N-acetyltransferase
MPKDAAVLIRLHQGDRGPLRPLFRLADDSEQQIRAYLNDGDVLAAVEDDEVIGYVQVVSARGVDIVELKSMAVREERQGSGIGRALVEAAVERCRDRGAARMLVATAAADIGNLRFYQRQGFRMLRVDRDAFGPEAGYAEDIVIDGIPLRDRVWLDRQL